MVSRYPTRIGPVMLLLLGAAFIPTTYLVIREGSWLGLLINLVALVGIALLFGSIYYVIREDVLEIHGSIFIKQRIPVKEIRSIRRTYNPLSAPAGSLRRLGIRYGEHGFALISPAREAEFISALKSLNPRIQVDL